MGNLEVRKPVGKRPNIVRPLRRTKEYTFQGGIPVQAGNPTGLNQSTLVIYVRASNDTTANLQTLRTNEQAELVSVSSFYRESSFNQLSFDFTHAPNTGWYQLPKTYDDYMWTQADIAAATPGTPQYQQAVDGEDLVQDFWGFFTDSLQAAQNDGFNVGNFSQILVIVIGPFHRGTSYSSTNFTLKDSQGNNFQVTLPVVVVSTNKDWSRTAHELGHAFGHFADLYNAANRRLGNWDLMDKTDCGAQTTGWHKDKKGSWFSGSQLKTIQRPLGINRIDDTTVLIPYETETPPSGAIQSLRLDVGGGLHLYVENRQKIAGQTGSQNIPANGVIITDADDNANQVNACPIHLFGGPITPGNTFTNQAYGNLKIEVSGTPPNLQVKTGWGPDPFFDLKITPWSPPPYDSPDIWIDSQVNGWDTYEHHDAAINPAVPGNPVRNGDRPRVGRANRVYARVFNDGNITANNVKVSFFVSDPAGIGDSGNWRLIDSVVIPQILAGGSSICYILWTPSASTHTCIIAKIDVQPGELNANNNIAQENVSDFDTTSSSPWAKVTSEIQVANPTRIYQNLRLEMTNLPRGWTGWVSERFVSLAPGEVKRVKYRIDPGKGGDLKLGSHVDVNVVGWIRDENSEVPLGGITSAIHLVEKSTVTIIEPPKTISLENLRKLNIKVSVTPRKSGLPVALDIRKKRTKSYSILNGKTNSSGIVLFDIGASIRNKLLKLQPDKTYVFRADLYGSSSVEGNQSLEVDVEVRL